MRLNVYIQLLAGQSLKKCDLSPVLRLRTYGLRGKEYKKPVLHEDAIRDRDRIFYKAEKLNTVKLLFGLFDDDKNQGDSLTSLYNGDHLVFLQ